MKGGFDKKLGGSSLVRDTFENRGPVSQPGKRTLTKKLPLVQRSAGSASAPADHGEVVPHAAAQGVAGGGGPLPHDDTLQCLFGRHDVSGVRANCWQRGCGFAAILVLCGCGSVASSAPDASNAPDTSGGAQCPASYDITLSGMSRYRLITTGGRAWDQSTSCTRDQAGATHLVVLETASELASVQALVDTSATALAAGVWVGGVQQHTATSPGDGWLGFDGQPLISGSWYDGPGTNGPPDVEPNDGDGTENGLEQFVIIKPSNSQGIKNGLQDSQGGNSKGALCECDGKPIAAVAAAEISFYGNM